MQREIKFRIWDKDNKKLYQPKEISRLHFTEGELYGAMLWEGDEILLNPLLLLFTGLKDKNGVEIYEGDIVRINYPDSVEGSVEFFQRRDMEDGKWAIRHSGWVLADYKQKTGKDAAKFGFHFSIEELREVIGNIYEHKNLLNHSQ